MLSRWPPYCSLTWLENPPCCLGDPLTVALPDWRILPVVYDDRMSLAVPLAFVKQLPVVISGRVRMLLWTEHWVQNERNISVWKRNHENITCQLLGQASIRLGFVQDWKITADMQIWIGTKFWHNLPSFFFFSACLRAWKTQGKAFHQFYLHLSFKVWIDLLVSKLR